MPREAFLHRAIRYGVADRFERSRLALVAGVDELALGQACPQLPNRSMKLTGDVAGGLEQNEDCLVLTVATPRAARRAPVMVWFHGGGYVSGSGESPKYDPTPLVQEGVVVVTVTSRLGIFGYLSPPGFEPDPGLSDQLLALQWVRGHIAEFGGDPARVTIFGQGSGGDSVYHLLLMEQAEGLFRRAIIQSAPLGPAIDRRPLVTAMQATVRDVLDGDPRDASIDELLLAQRAATKVASKSGVASQSWPFGPRFTGDLLPRYRQVEERLTRAATRVDLMIGFTKDDALPLLSAPARGTALVSKSIGRAATHFNYAEPAGRLVALWRKAGGAAISYRFDWSPVNSRYGACHFLDVPFLLGNPSAWRDARMLGRRRSIDPSVAAAMRSTWASFARNGAELIDGDDLRF